MQGSNNTSLDKNNIDNDSKTIIIQTDKNAQNGQSKCPKCGATDISLNINSGKLRCNFCRYEFDLEKIASLETDVSQLQGQIIGSGATDISENFSDIITLKCSSCGAEVVIDTASAPQARCHWCRNTLSINQQIPNGSVPDVVLPFKITKEEAKHQINNFVKSRKFYAHPIFKKEFTTENIMGVYFPYMIVDVNSHAKLVGQGEKLVRSYIVRNNNSSRTYYDADLYNVEREFDLAIDGLTVESNKERLDTQSSDKTNNIINSIMPFDIENCVKYNANYLKGYTSEKRNINIEQLKKLVDIQAKDIARFSANKTLNEYNRGVAWSSEEFDIKGQRWQAAYLPVWLYSYYQNNGNTKILHYVAVNARTKETMGSVPIHMPKLIAISLLVEFVGFIAMIFVDSDYGWLFLSIGFIYYFIIYSKYRNSKARHKYETETNTKMSNLRKVDNYVFRRKKLTNSRIIGANNYNVNGANISNKVLDSLVSNNLGDEINSKKDH